MTALRVDDWIEIKSKDEILATLDDNGCLDALPFMPEMLGFCGKTFRVFKCAHKVDDRIEKTGLRRLADCVILKDVRCDGASHGGCEAGCQILWKEAWLRTARRGRKEQSYPNPAQDRSLDSATPNSFVLDGRCTDATLMTVAERTDERRSSGQKLFMCQATELRRATSHLSRWDLGQYFRDIWYGNISFFEWLRGFCIWLFNEVQALRGGCAYPFLEPGRLSKTPSVDLSLQPGEMVQVRTKQEIQMTLDNKSKNRGLWFDREMVRYCGGRFRVLRRAHRIIEEKSGRMLDFPIVSIVLDGVTNRGDYHQFCPQNEYIFWREVWLERIESH